jgi:Spy/CpxP family protein refolding chaperone
MMLSRTLFFLLSITFGATVVGSSLFPSVVLADQQAVQSLQLNSTNTLISLKASSKDNDRLFEQLNLSSSQIQKVRAINEQYEPAILSRRQALTTAKNELRALEANQASSVQIKAKQQQIKKLKQELATVRKRYATAMRAVLSAEQWSKLQQIMKERREQRNEE